MAIEMIVATVVLFIFAAAGLAATCILAIEGMVRVAAAALVVASLNIFGLFSVLNHDNQQHRIKIQAAKTSAVVAVVRYWKFNKPQGGFVYQRTSNGNI